jgi:CubicO group peptidase (beta-lactamase class C family)
VSPTKTTLNPADLEAWLDGFLPYALEHGRIPGAVVVVVQDGRPLLQKGYGHADTASRRTVDPTRTLFRPGSVSKLFTWTAVMQQVEAGRLDLDRDVNSYLDFRIPPFGSSPITLRHLMTHSAGFEESIRHLISADPKAVMPLRDYVRQALPERVFAPGTTPAYSNYATALAGYIVERVSGMSFDDYVERRIFAQIGMVHSSFRQPLPPRLKPMMASGYATGEAAAKPFEIVIPAPAGSLSASGADMGRFMIAHLAQGRGLMRPETARLMHEFRAPNIGPLNAMALGLYEQRINGRRLIGHGGDTGWFHSYLWLFPSEEVGVFISVNSGGRQGAAQAIRSGLIHKFADRYFPDSVTIRPIDARSARQHAEMMAGTYLVSRGSFSNFLAFLQLLSPMKVVATPQGKLSLPSLDGLSVAPREWVEVAPFIWRDRATGERLAAEVRDGKVARFSIDTFSPFTVLTPAPPGVNAAWLLPTLVASLMLALIAALSWPVRALVRRSFKAEFVLKERRLLAYRLTRAAAWGVILAAVGWLGLVLAFSSDITSVGGRLDWLLNALRVLTPVTAIGLAGPSAWHLWFCFRDRRRWTMKLGATLLVLSAMVLVWVTFRFNLYGFGMVY